eukprot:TRINITY_DN6544_c0_g2_i3.p1 TRINITY_DN6544_c0_g2~~TRINITY_DN6544_c0_g2_i3.p1  ORF type:complete len:218 (-),score=12.88 TRINITY_DN6544_c0_g2_i3:111-764(-)
MNNMGIGLGLMISNKIAQVLGAEKIQLSSEYGRGSYFYFDLPSARFFEFEDDNNEYPRDTEVSRDIRIFRSNCRAKCDCKQVLVVDDNEYNRMVLVRMLQRKGMQCIEANDGLEAYDVIIERLNQEYACGHECHRFKVILSDLNMPLMNGYELLTKVKELEREGKLRKSLPFVVVSAFDNPSEIAEGFRLGMSSYMTKPISEDEVNKLLCSIEESTK